MFKVFQPKYFAKSLDSMAKQVLPPSIYKVRGVKGLELMDVNVLRFIDRLRKNLGVPLTVNNWSVGGGYSQSGLRDVGHYGSYAAMERSFSTHKYGKALDFRSNHMFPHEIRKHIIENQHLYPMVSFMEVGITWVHVDCRTRLSDTWCRFWHPKLGFITRQEVLAQKL